MLTSGQGSSSGGGGLGYTNQMDMQSDAYSPDNAAGGINPYAPSGQGLRLSAEQAGSWFAPQSAPSSVPLNALGVDQELGGGSSPTDTRDYGGSSPSDGQVDNPLSGQALRAAQKRYADEARALGLARQQKADADIEALNARNLGSTAFDSRQAPSNRALLNAAEQDIAQRSAAYGAQQVQTTRGALIAAASLGGEFSVLDTSLPPDIASGYAGPAGSMVRDPVNTLVGLGKSAYNNVIAAAPVMITQLASGLAQSELHMSQSILGIDTQELRNQAATGAANIVHAIEAQPHNEAQRVGMALGDVAALGALGLSASGRASAKALDAWQTFDLTQTMKSDLAVQDSVYRLVKSSDLVHYENANAVAGKHGAPTYFSLDAGESVAAHMRGAQMDPKYGPYDTLLKIPKTELVEPSVPHLRGYDEPAMKPIYGREYNTSAYSEFGHGGFRQIMGTTRSYSSDWIIKLPKEAP